MQEMNGGKNTVETPGFRTRPGDELYATDAMFKGPTTTSGAVGAPRSVAASIRQRHDLYVIMRPIKTF